VARRLKFAGALAVLAYVAGATAFWGRRP
jgi:hypothetical protein